MHRILLAPRVAARTGSLSRHPHLCTLSLRVRTTPASSFRPLAQSTSSLRASIATRAVVRPVPLSSFLSSITRHYSGQIPRPLVLPESVTSAIANSQPLYSLLRTPTPFQAIVKPVLFTAVATAGVFTAAAYIWERRQVTLMKRIQAWRSQSKSERPSAREFVQAQSEILKEQWGDILERYRWIQEIGVPVEIQKMVFMARQRWMEFSPGERTVWGIIALNSVVFGAWQIPRLAPFMEKWFMHHPASGQSITLLTSMFSHQHFWHFGLNMFALHSFAVPLHDTMGMEQFVAFYLTTGISASLVSHLFTVARVPWARMIPSLGASGAIFGCLSSTAYLDPEASVYIIFLPFFPIKIPMALGAMMGLDLLGIIKNWRMFDHYAHLAGSTFGLGYMYAGKDWVWHPLQRKAIEWNKDSNLFSKLSTASTPVVETKKTARSDEHDHTAKEYVQARAGQLKHRVQNWWNDRKNGGGGQGQ